MNPVSKITQKLDFYCWGDFFKKNKKKKENIILKKRKRKKDK